MSKILKKKSVSGFTLVELLIVVAIIGVLATIGVPTFKKMLAKAKKSEAKVALGGIATVEAAFFAEYGAYGNRLDKVGFELEGTGVNRIYTIGFVGTGCSPVSAIQPATSYSQGSALMTAFPSYYDTTTSTAIYSLTATTAPSSCIASDVDNTSAQSYVAQATGIVVPGKLDQWTINQIRNLANVTDGI